MMDIFDYTKIKAIEKKFDRVENTNDLEKPISTATQAAIDFFYDEITRLEGVHDSDPRLVDSRRCNNTFDDADISKVNLSLDNVDNTSDMDKPVSTAQQTESDTKEDAFSKNSAFNRNFGATSSTVTRGDDARLSDSRKCNNEFDDIVISKTNLELERVDNTNDLEKPISTATQTEIDTKEDAFTKNTAFNKNFGVTASEVTVGNDPRLADSRRCDNTFDDITVSKTNLELERVDNTNDLEKPTNTITQGKLDDINSRLTNVDNVFDLDKPISNATQAALNLKQNASNAVTTNTVQTISALKDFTTRPTVNGNDVWDAGNLVPGIWWQQQWGGVSSDLELTLVPGLYKVIFETFDHSPDIFYGVPGSPQPIHKISVLLEIHTQGHLAVSQFASDYNPMSNPEGTESILPENGDRIYVISEGWRIKGYLLKNGTVPTALDFSEIWKGE